MLRILTMFFALLVLSGCKGFIQNNINSATDEPAAGLSQFEEALERGYLDLAQKEIDEDDFGDANYFLRRAMNVKLGGNVQPTTVAERSFTPQNQARAERARSGLINFINGPIRNTRPAIAAQAQVMFDCWMQELEENRQPQDISLCQDGFANAIDGLEGISSSSATASATTTETETATEESSTSGTVTETASAASESTSSAVVTEETAAATASGTEVGAEIIVYFAFDSHSKVTSDISELGDTASEAVTQNVKFVLVTASTDSSGGFDYNYKLSKKRGEHVRNILVNAGIDTNIINIIALGEKDLPVSTADGIKEPRNRRAKVEFRF